MTQPCYLARFKTNRERQSQTDVIKIYIPSVPYRTRLEGMTYLGRWLEDLSNAPCPAPHTIKCPTVKLRVCKDAHSGHCCSLIRGRQSRQRDCISDVYRLTSPSREIDQ